jgi:hypothetical protein
MIKNDNTVSINKENVNLPYYAESFYVVRYKNLIIAKSRDYKLKVIYDSSDSSIVVRASRWYHGKVSGLFGNMDGETYNDLIIGSRTPYKNNRALESSCNYLFSSKISPLANCFSVVDPKPYKTLCSKQKRCSNRSCAVEQRCDTVKLYLQQCKMSRVNVESPKTCDRKSVGLKTTVKKTEVIFLVETKPCQDRSLKYIASFISDKLENLVQGEVQFGMIGFGSSRYPRSFTHKNKLFSSIKDFSGSVIANIKFEKDSNRYARKSYYKSLSRAVDYASNVFTDNASNKIIVVVPCKKCGLKLHPEMYEKQGIKLLSVQLFEDDILVQDKNMFYTRTYPYGKSDLSKKVMCKELSSQSNGIVFEKNTMLHRRSSNIQIALDSVITRAISLNTNNRK